MKSRDNDPFFTVDVPIVRIRRCTPAEAAARAERWARSRAMKLRRRLETGDKTERRAGRQAAAVAGGSAGPEPLPPWHELPPLGTACAPAMAACSKATKRKSRCASPFTRAAPAGVRS